MPVSRRLRFEVLRRDEHTCRYCGVSAPDAPLTVDHIIPTTLGGNDDPSNLATACAPCNAGKSSIAPDAAVVADVDQSALRWSAAIKRAAVIQAEKRAERETYIEAFDGEWQRWRYSGSQEVTRPIDWRLTIARQFDAGLDLETLIAVARNVLPRATHPDITRVGPGGVLDEDMWRYLCGALRNAMTERAEIAAGLIEAGVA